MKYNQLVLVAILAVTVIAISPHVTHPVSAQMSQNVINQLSNDITDAKNTADNAAQNYAKVAQSFQEVKDTTDALYVISMTGIGIGAAGVVIAVIAITKKNQA
jgi:hypothetical protein